MADLAQMPTSMLNLPALESVPASSQGAEEEGQFTATIRAAYSQHKELERLYALALTEIDALRKELAALRSGQGIQIVIDGKKFVPAEVAHLVTDALSEQTNGHKSELADSFIL